MNKIKCALSRAVGVGGVVHRTLGYLYLSIGGNQALYNKEEEEETIANYGDQLQDQLRVGNFIPRGLWQRGLPRRPA